MSELHHSPLHELNEEFGASFTDFGGWIMPLKYGRELEEHRAVRERVGVFDLSHMGEIVVRGAQAGEFLDYVLISSLSELAVGKAKYSMIVTAEGGIIDDLITYRLAEEEYMVVPNAGNQPAVWECFTQRQRERFATAEVELDNQSYDTALIAVQGPKSCEFVSALAPQAEQEITDLRYYSAIHTQLENTTVLLARTGYTGEDGFEIYLSAADAPNLFRSIVTQLERFDGALCGLAARDSLRLEAAMPLYGHELSTALTPVDAGMRGLVSRTKTPPFYGDVLLEQPPAPRVIVGLRGTGRRAARAGSRLFIGEAEVGEITSGQLSPTLGFPIALAYVDRNYASEGTEVEADVRGKRQPMVITPRPFYSHN